MSNNVDNDNEWGEWIEIPEDLMEMPESLEGAVAGEFEVMLKNGRTISPDSYNPCEFSWRFAKEACDRITHYRLIKSSSNSSDKEQSLRYNEGKPELSYILDAMPALKDMVAVMEFGANKYARNNWKKGFPKEKLLDSLLRHADAFYQGEDLDPESNLPHVGHILCNAMFLAYHYGSHNGGKSDE